MSAPRRRVAWLLGLVLGAAATLALAAPAGAATSCSYNGAAEVLDVTMDTENDSVKLSLLGNEILVRGEGPVLACGGPPTLANTEFVNVFDNSGAGGTQVSILGPAGFASIEINLVLGDGFDRLLLGGSEAGSHLVIGEDGVDSDASGSRDVNFIGPPEQLLFSGGNGPDTVSAQGSAVTGAPLAVPVCLLEGGAGDDALAGSEGTDLLDGEGGDDVIRGFGGDDVLRGDGFAGPGENTIEGGAGTDTLQFAGLTHGVAVDLGRTDRQDTGAGKDELTGVESVTGTQFDDVLLGSEADNMLKGGDGDDMLAGRGGYDHLEGGIGSDTASYADAPGGVAVDLEAGIANGGAGPDLLTLVENLIGSPFADTITGSAAANLITPLGGADAVRALGGADAIEARDADADAVSCGDGTDLATADRLSLDAIQSDCETVDALPEPPSGPAGGEAPATPRARAPSPPAAGGAAAGSRPPLALSLAGARRQRLLGRGAVVIIARCRGQACAVVARASGRLPGGKAKRHGRLRLGPVRRRLAKGRTARIRLRLDRRQRARLRAALRAGARPRLRVMARATDVAGDSARRSLEVLLRG